MNERLVRNEATLETLQHGAPYQVPKRNPTPIDAFLDIL